MTRSAGGDKEGMWEEKRRECGGGDKEYGSVGKVTKREIVWASDKERGKRVNVKGG